jgi:low affinity Fe/Cu permease
MNELFRKFAQATSRIAGSSWAFLIAAVVVIVWVVSGPFFHYSDTWQLVINTGTTIVTFLMVFLIQNTQNRDSKSLHLKLDELIRATTGAQNVLIESEDFTDEDLEELRKAFERLQQSESTSVKQFTTALQKKIFAPAEVDDND